MYFMCVSCAACVIASSSRGAIMRARGRSVYLSLLSTRRVRAFAGSAMLAYLAYLVMPGAVSGALSSCGRGPDLASRIAYWPQAREMLSQHPYFSVGLLQLDSYYRDNYFDPSLILAGRRGA